MAVDYMKYMDVPVDDIEAPKKLPVGHYVASVVKGEAREAPWSKEVVLWTTTFRVINAMEDVEQDALPDQGGKGMIVTWDLTLKDPEQPSRTEETQFRLRRFGEEACEISGKGLRLPILLQQTTGCEVCVFVDHRPNKKSQDGEFYVEQTGIVAAALPEALVQDYDGTLRIAPAIPPGWNFDGSVFVRGETKVDVQVRNGAVTTVGFEVRRTQNITVRGLGTYAKLQMVRAADQ